MDPYISLTGKTALIVGASQGIGLAVAKLFARYGAEVAMVDHSGRSEKEAASIGPVAKAFRCDCSDEDQVKQTVEDVLGTFGKIDILVNNAAVIYRKDTLGTTAQEWDLAMEIGVKGTFLFCKYVLPKMIAQGHGNIINTASSCSMKATEGAASYNAVKGAIVNYTRALAIDYAAQNIRANAVCPGDVLTPMLIEEGKQMGLITTGDPKTEKEKAEFEAFLKIRGSYRPMGRIATPEQIAYSYLFLASDMSIYATGSCVVVDGGRLA